MLQIQGAIKPSSYIHTYIYHEESSHSKFTLKLILKLLAFRSQQSYSQNYYKKKNEAEIKEVKVII